MKAQSSFCTIVFTLCLGCGAEITDTKQDSAEVIRISPEITSKADKLQLKTKSEIKSNRIQQTECPPISDLAEQLISLHSDKMRGTEPPCTSRAVSKMNGLELVLFTLEGQCWGNTQLPKGQCGNNYSRYMTGVLEGQALKTIQVGEKTDFSAASVDNVENVIIVSGVFHQEGDGLCCPSKEGVREFKIFADSFNEIKTLDFK